MLTLFCRKPREPMGPSHFTPRQMFKLLAAICNRRSVRMRPFVPHAGQTVWTVTAWTALGDRLIYEDGKLVARIKESPHV